MRRLSLCLGLMVVMVGLLIGCQTGPRIYHVKGTVQYKNQPVPAGVVYFDPDSTQQNDGPQGYAFIKDGVFDTAAKGGRGVVGGAYVVRIEGFDGKPGEELPMGRALFVDFKKSLDLPKQDSTQDFQVGGK